MAGRRSSRSLVVTVAMVTIEGKRQRIDLVLQSMKDSAELINLGERHLGQRHGLLSAVVDPGSEIVAEIAQRRDDLLVGLDLGLQDPDVPQMFVVIHARRLVNGLASSRLKEVRLKPCR